jgi:transcriptional antiterminator Rof (Rho-off)
MTYVPISCTLYDELELLAMRKSAVSIEIKNGEKLADTFITFESRKKEGEFALLKSGREIRLDELKAVNGIDFSGSC